MRTLYLLAAGIGLVSIVFLASCAEDDIVPPAVSKISPGEGSFGMEVTVTGSNFSMNKEENLVRFNGVDAEIISVKRDTLIVKVPRGSSSGPVTVAINNLASIGVAFRYYDVYITGSEEDETTHTVIPKLWKNGIEVPLPTDKQATALAITLSGSNTYVTGYTFPASEETSFSFGYWMNENFTALEDAEFIRGISETAISGGDAYVAGAVYDAPYDPEADFSPYSVRYWKDGVLEIPDQEGYVTGRALAIDVSGTDTVHLGGVVGNSERTYAAYWQNGTLEIMGNNLEIRDLHVVEKTVHMVGSGVDPEGNPLPITYWKDGVSQVITDGTRLAEANALAVQGSTIYIVGSEMFPSGSGTGAKLWKNGIGTYLFTEAVESRGAGVMVVDNHVFTAGHVLGETNYQAYYTFDGEVIYVTDGSKRVVVTGIYVR